MERDTEQKAIVALSDSWNAQARSNVREKCSRTQTGRFKSVSSEIPPRKRLPEIFNRSAYAQRFHEWKKTKEKEKSNRARVHARRW